jgi:hypothetical protein
VEEVSEERAGDVEVREARGGEVGGDRGPGFVARGVEEAERDDVARERSCGRRWPGGIEEWRIDEGAGGGLQDMRTAT